MKDQKIFAGPRLRRVRLRLGLTQSQMAAELSISASYLNLMERNQRPLTVQVLLKLATVYDLDMAELHASVDPAALEALKEVFSDPLLASEIPSPSELEDVAETAPNVARAISRLFDAYQEGNTRLSDLSHLLAKEDIASPETVSRLPFDHVKAWFDREPPWIPELEQASEDLVEVLRPRDDQFGALKSHLREQYGVGVQVLPRHAMASERSRFDRHSMRLFLSEKVSLEDRAYLTAIQLAQMGYGTLLDQLTANAEFKDAEAVRLCRAGLARRLARAILVPASRLRLAGLDLSYDVLALSGRFAVRPSLLMARLAAVGAMPDSPLPNVGLVQSDDPGTALQRLAHPDFPLPRVGALCGRLPLFDDLRPGVLVAAGLETAEGAEFIAVAIGELGLSPIDGGEAAQIRTMLVLNQSDAEDTVYAFSLGQQARPIGVSCRLCERLACTHRAEPPATRPSALLDQVVGQSEYALI